MMNMKEQKLSKTLNSIAKNNPEMNLDKKCKEKYKKNKKKKIELLRRRSLSIECSYQLIKLRRKF